VYGRTCAGHSAGYEEREYGHSVAGMVIEEDSGTLVMGQLLTLQGSRAVYAWCDIVRLVSAVCAEQFVAMIIMS